MIEKIPFLLWVIFNIELYILDKIAKIYREIIAHSYIVKINLIYTKKQTYSHALSQHIIIIERKKYTFNVT